MSSSTSTTTATGRTLVLVGGTGGLGQELAKGLVTAAGFDHKKALVRGDLAKGKALADLGWELVLVTDLTDPVELESVLNGAAVVVSTLAGGDMAKLDMALIQAAKKVGTVELFVPSQFGVDYRRWGTSSPFLAGKKAVLDAAERAGLPTLQVFNGMFADSVLDFLADPGQAKATIIGDGTTPLSWTKRSDIGYVLAKALADPAYYRSHGGTLSISGDTLGLKDALALLEKAIGKPLAIETIDANEALEVERELTQKGLEGDMGAFYGALKYHLLGEPGRGNDGADVSAEAKTYGVTLAPLEQVLTEVYGS